MDDQSTDLHHASSLVDRVGKASIELHAGFDPKLLREAVQALERYRLRKTKRKLRPSKGFSSATSSLQ
ncbi:hypothetical protein [Paenibacillus apiarius]|uniref:hypothetical protein n=1 Tax=Paenibacillus apiarius TaxID=46240 RepID=UPI003B3BBE4E